MAIPKLYLYGGAAVAALGVFVMTRPKAAPVDNSGAFYPPMVYGGGGTTTAATTPATTDNSVSQLLGGQLALATVQQQTSEFQTGAQKDVALAGYSSALDLAKQDTTKALGLANINAQSALDLSNNDLTKTRMQKLGDMFAAMFGGGGGGSGALNLDTPTKSQSAGGATVAAFGGGAVSLPGTPASSQTSGFTHSNVYGNLGFDPNGNIFINMTRDTGSSFDPLNVMKPATQPVVPAIKAA